MEEYGPIKLSEIHADDEFNCRGSITPVDVIDLARDIERQGLIQPVIIELMSAEKQAETGCKYRLLAGYRRRMAHIVLKKNTIKAIIHKPMSSADAYIFNLSENVNRKDLTILQEANALKKLKYLGVTETDCAARLGKSRGWVQVRYLLLSLPDEVQAEVEAGVLNQTHVRELYSIYQTAGIDSCYTAVKKIKDAAASGRKISVNPHKNKPTVKKHRSKSEITTMLEHIYDSVKPGFHTRCLAWASGEISDLDLFEDIKIYAASIGIDYTIPDQPLDEI